MGVGDSVLVAGFTANMFSGATAAGEYDAFVRNYSSAGTELWTRQFGSPRADGIRAVDVDDVGNILVCGFTDDALPGQTNLGLSDAFVVSMIP